MSPSEADLRAALRAGGGDGDRLDVDRIIAGGRAVRAQRRVRLLTTAAVTVVVAGVGAGTAALVGSDGSGHGSSRAEGGTTGAYSHGSSGSDAAPGGAALGPTGTRESSGALGSLPAIACPTSLPDYRLPGGGSPGQFGADGPLFRRPVSAVVVCAYGTPTATGAATAAPSRLVLTDDAARTVAASLEKAPQAKATGACPLYRSADARSLAIVGVGADGRAAGVVTTSVGVPACSVRVTNGTALRYQWQPPAVLRKALDRLNPVAGRSHGPVVQSSPSSS